MQALTDEQIEQEIDWAKDRLYFMDVEERTAAFYIRQRALENFILRFEEEQQRRISRQELAERLGPLSLESQDPAQLPLPLFNQRQQA